MIALRARTKRLQLSTQKPQKDLELAELSRAFIKKENRLTDLEQRLLRIEKRIKSNERFARTFAGCMSTQVLAIDAVTDVLRRALREDIVIQDELMSAIRHYDKHTSSVVGVQDSLVFYFGFFQLCWQLLLVPLSIGFFLDSRLDIKYCGVNYGKNY